METAQVPRAAHLKVSLVVRINAGITIGGFRGSIVAFWAESVPSFPNNEEVRGTAEEGLKGMWSFASPKLD